MSKKSKYLEDMNDDEIIDFYITQAEDERTVMAKTDTKIRWSTLDAAHTSKGKAAPSFKQKMKNTSQAFGTELCRFARSLTRDKRKVSFARETKTVTFNSSDEVVMVTYDSGSDINYVSEADRTKLGLPILRILTKRVTVANAGAIKGKYVTRLPYKQLSPNEAEADTFEDFPTSLMSMGKTSDDVNVSVFNKEDVKVYKEEDVLITCKCKPILVGKRDEHGRYHIPLIQQKGQWQPRVPNNRTKKHLQHANSV